MRLTPPLMKQDGFLFRKDRLWKDYMKYYAQRNLGNYGNKLQLGEGDRVSIFTVNMGGEKGVKTTSESDG